MMCDRSGSALILALPRIAHICGIRNAADKMLQN